MKKTVPILLLIILVLALFVGLLACQRQGGEGLFAMFVFKNAEATANTVDAATTPGPRLSPTPLPTPMPEDPALCAELAWEALFTYPSHEAPVRVISLLTEPGSPGDVRRAAMIREGKLMDKGVYYSKSPISSTSSETVQAPPDPAEWTAQALDSVPVGLLDSIYAETPALALAAYDALREAGRNDAVEVICAGITVDVLAAMLEDHFSMGAAAGVYENEMRVVYADEYRAE